MSTCPGTCCEKFPISRTKDKDVQYLTRDDLALMQWDPSADPDLPIILDMLIEVDEERYTCRYYDRASRLCKNYDGRPGMCRNFPQYGDPSRVCEFCTYAPGDDFPGVRYGPVELTGIFTPWDCS